MSGDGVYRGRFAPSPTGPLHQGSLIAAVASYLDARAGNGRWLLRIEDIDPPREVSGASDQIRRSLEAHGLYWDESVLFQSTRLDAYREALEQLADRGDLFPCICTRATLGPGGQCGGRCDPRGSEGPRAMRLRLRGPAAFDDLLLGHCAFEDAPGELVLWRRDGLCSYALAVVVDDAWQRVTHVVRGRDLLSQTPAQREVLRLLGHSPPQYAHIPLLRDKRGYKLSKQTGARALDDRRALANLRLALHQLGQTSADLEAGSPAELLELAGKRWSRTPLAGEAAQPTVYESPNTS